MLTFTVHEPPDRNVDRLDRAEAMVFVKEGFSLAAALLTPFWMIANRLWLALLVYLGVLVLLELGIWVAGVPQQFGTWSMIALHLLVGFEGDAIRRWSLGRRGFAMVGSVSGRDGDDCERRFFDDWLKEQPYLGQGGPQGGPSGYGARRDARDTGGRLNAAALWFRKA